MACGLWDLSGQFFLNSNGAKRGQGDGPAGPKLQVGLPEPLLAKSLNGPKAPKIAINCGRPQGSIHGLWKSPEANSHLQYGVVPPISAKHFAPLNRPKPVGTISGAYMVLYTILHHFSSAIQW
ncbi:hypothetical protein O181_010095 [Austropuccinia psidii MF-1]|uniref:Uncharacterized protein n=1 Tax=Austropuccinia psidii MF-1 TaxID=1389203 RepID=A0A9Q3GKJ5_9BASI|nr:hypothetical protein [Austropuccinia psidii MF-1]